MLYKLLTQTARLLVRLMFSARIWHKKPISSKTTAMHAILSKTTNGGFFAQFGQKKPISSKLTVAQEVFNNFQPKRRIYVSCTSCRFRQIHSCKRCFPRVVAQSERFLLKLMFSAPFKKNQANLDNITVARCFVDVLAQILWIFAKSRDALCTFLTKQANLQLNPLFCKSFSSKSTISCEPDAFWTSLTKQTKFNQNHSCACCFAQVSPKTAYQYFLHVLDKTSQFKTKYTVAHTVLYKFQG